LSIGAYSFGAEHHMSGGLALAEALGRFGQEGVTAAYYASVPPARSPTAHAFRAFRNYDGKGSGFLELSLKATSDRTTSLFASISTDRRKLVAIALNLDPKEAADAKVFLTGCNTITEGKAFVYAGGSEGFTPQEGSVKLDSLGTLTQRLPPYSITVFELRAPPDASVLPPVLPTTQAGASGG
jgi:hypothetical protein